MRSIALLLLASSIAAQTSAVPNGTLNFEGGSNNTIPFWNVSNTYQQIHNATDVATATGSATPLLTSISFRKDGLLSSGLTGRSIDAQISMGISGVTSATPTNTFATNIGATPTIVLPYTTINLPSLTNSALPNPVGWTFPFTTPYSYASALGDLCWEMRHLNSVSTTAPLDAWQATAATVLPNIGLGCVATGQTLPAAITTRSLSITTGAYRNLMSRAAVSTPAAFFIGITPTTITLPGLCSSLEFLPIADVSGVTSATGTWDLTLTFGSLVGAGQATLYGQFAFFDGGLSGIPVGLSDASKMQTPPGTTGLCARVWAAGFNAGLGFETATTGSVGTSYGLITMFN